MSLSDVLTDGEIFPLPARHVQEIVFQLFRALGCTFLDPSDLLTYELTVYLSYTFKGDNSYKPEAREHYAFAFRSGVCT